MSMSSSANQYALQDISLQFASLTLARACPRGVYLLQDELDPLTLHGALFPPSSGPYSGGVFKFIIYWPGSPNSPKAASASTAPYAASRSGYANQLSSTSLKGEGSGIPRTHAGSSRPAPRAPVVVFQKGVSHPLVHNNTQQLSLQPRFPSWKPRQDTLSHLLYYIRDCFGQRLLDDIKLREGWWTNAEMGRLLRTSPPLFNKLAAQSVSLSTSKSVLHSQTSSTDQASGEEDPFSRGITFPLDISGNRNAAKEGQDPEKAGDEILEELKRELLYGSRDLGIFAPERESDTFAPSPSG